MKAYIKGILQLANIISGGAMIVFGMFGILAEILNPPIFEKLLAKLKIPLTYDNYLLVSYISLAIFIVTYFILKNFLAINHYVF